MGGDMKTNTLSNKKFSKLSLSLFLLLFCTPALFAKTKYRIHPVHSNVTWMGSKPTGTHKGNVEIKSGNIERDGDNFEGEIIIDLNTITNTDLKSKSQNDDLVGHLKSEDFFDVSKFPEASLKITKTNKQTGKVFQVTGTVTIKDVSEKISFPVNVVFSKGELKADGKLKLDRTKFGIKYKSKKFFAALKDKFINDEIVLDFQIRAVETK